MQFYHILTHVFDNINLSQEIFAIDTWGAVICFLGHGRKHVLKPGFHLQQTPRPRHKKQSDYLIEQSSLPLIALFLLQIGCCRGRNLLYGNQA